MVYGYDQIYNAPLCCSQAIRLFFPHLEPTDLLIPSSFAFPEKNYSGNQTVCVFSYWFLLLNSMHLHIFSLYGSLFLFSTEHSIPLMCHIYPSTYLSSSGFFQVLAMMNKYAINICTSFLCLQRFSVSLTMIRRCLVL